MSAFKKYKDTNEICPICKGISGPKAKCRESITTQYVWCHQRDAMGEITGFTLVQGELPFYKPDGSRNVSQEDYFKWQMQVASRKEALRIATDKRDNAIRDMKPNSLEANAQIKAMENAGELAVSSQDLKRRGLSEKAIIKFHLFNLTQGVHVAAPATVAKPVASLDLKGYYRGATGLIIPIRNVDGLMHGLEIKPDVVTGGAKYLHPVTTTRDTGLEFDIDYKLANGERPLDYNPQSDNPGVLFCEGNLKPKVASHIHKITTVGATGMSYNNCDTQLQAIIAKHKNEPLIIALDAGMQLNTHIIKKTQILHDRLMSLGALEVRVADWGQWCDKSVGDIDEIKMLKFTYKNLRHISDLVDGAIEMFIPNKTAELKPHVNYGLKEGVDFYTGFRAITEQARNEGKFVLINPPTGYGKSYSMVKMAQEEDASSVILMRSTKAPDIPALKTDFDRLTTRNNGRNFVNGGKYMTENNCWLTDKFSDAYQKGVSSEGICTKCKHFKKCKVSTGEGYGFIHQYKSALQEGRLYATTQGYRANYQEDRKANLFFDEIGAMTTDKTVVVESKDMGNMLLFIKYAAMNSGDFQMGNAAEALIMTLQFHLKESKVGKYGVLLSDITKEFEHIDLEQCNKLLPTLANLMLDTNKDNVTSGRISYDFVTPVVRTLMGANNTQIRLLPNRMSILEREDNIRDLIEASDNIVFSDATIDAYGLSIKTGVSVDDIITLKMKHPEYSNITFKHFKQKAGKSIGKQETGVMQQLLDQIASQHTSVGVIDYKARTDELKYPDDDLRLVHWANARGSNNLEAVEALVIIDYSRANLGGILDQYNVLTGRNVDTNDEDFQMYYTTVNQSNLIQEIGRLRSMRRMSEQLTVYLIAPYPAEVSSRINWESLDLESEGVNGIKRGDAFKEQLQRAVITAILNGDIFPRQRVICDVLPGTSVTKIRRAISTNWNSYVEQQQAFIHANGLIAGNTKALDDCMRSFWA